MSSGTVILILLAAAMVGVHLFGHRRHGAHSAGGGHGGGGCCGGHSDYAERTPGAEPAAQEIVAEPDDGSDEPSPDQRVAQPSASG